MLLRRQFRVELISWQLRAELVGRQFRAELIDWVQYLQEGKYVKNFMPKIDSELRAKSQVRGVANK